MTYILDGKIDIFHTALIMQGFDLTKEEVEKIVYTVRFIEKKGKAFSIEDTQAITIMTKSD